MIMTLSMKKIVESRNRRGGASLHRNLLVAGVLFKARDVLLAVSAVAPDDSFDKTSPADDGSNLHVDRKSGDDDDKVECEQTAEMTSPSLPADERSRLDDKENVAPCNEHQPVTSDHPRSDDTEPSSRAVKRTSRDSVDDDVTPCKTTRADTPVERHDDRLTESAMDVADDDDVACSDTVSDELCLQTYSSSSVSQSSPSRQAPTLSVVWRSTTVSRLPYVADPVVVRPLFVVQVV